MWYPDAAGAYHPTHALAPDSVGCGHVDPDHSSADRLSNTLAIATMPTIWDRLAQAGVSHGYYYSNVPFLAFWGLEYLPFAQPYSRFLFDALTGTLPAVSFLDPKFTLLDDGTGNDDHPHADIRAGDAFLSQAFHAVASGPTGARRYSSSPTMSGAGSSITRRS